MKTFALGALWMGLSFLLSSCFLVSVPVKATGEIIEKSAYATGEAASRGIRRATTPVGEPGPPRSPDCYAQPEEGHYGAGD